MEEKTIDLREYFHIIKKKFFVIVISAVICGVISGLISFFVLNPVYETSTTVIVNKEIENYQEQMNTSDDLNFAQQLALTYGEIIKSKAVINPTIDKLKLDSTYEEISDNITVTNVTDTQIIKISVKNNNPRLASTICNTIAQIFSDKAQWIVKSSSIEIIDTAGIPKEPIKPNKVMNIVIAMILGVICSIFIIFLQESLNTKVKSRKDIEDKLGVPVLGVVPKY